MARVIQEQIKKPLAGELLFGKLTTGGHVSISAEDDRLTFEYETSEAARLPEQV